MFDAMSEAIKKLLIKEIPIKKNEIDIVFDQPTDEWAAGIANPTLNVYLYEIRENRSLRGAEQFSEYRRPDGMIEIRRNPVRVDLNYLITAWSKKELDQHHMLGLTMMALLRAAYMPADLLPDELKSQPFPIKLDVGQPDDTKNWSDFWNTLHNKHRPGLILKATILMDPYPAKVAVSVEASEVKFAQKGADEKEIAQSKNYYTVGGELISQKRDPSTLTLIWEERGLELHVEDGNFLLRKVETGTHHISVRFGDRVLKRHQFSIPLIEPLRIEI